MKIVNNKTKIKSVIFLKGSFILLFLLTLSVYSYAEQPDKADSGCRDERVVIENDLNPECNLLSIPAREVVDPYVFAASYFNNRMNIILRENVVSEFSYEGVPFYIYKSFMNADSKKSYWKNCIKDIYEYEIIY